MKTETTDHTQSTAKLDDRSDLLTRAAILNMLSDEENAKVSTAETADALAHGDEYIDLKRLEQGVQRADGATTPMNRVLPRKAVHQATWTKIVAQLKTSLTPTKAPVAKPSV